MAQPTKPSEEIDFATTLMRLETLVEKLESGELGLEDSLQAFEDGVQLTREARKKLELAELKIQQLQLRDPDENSGSSIED